MDKERADAAEATLDYVVALKGGAENLPSQPPPGFVFLVRKSADAGIVGTLVDYRGIEVAVFVEGGTVGLMLDLAKRLGFTADRIRGLDERG